jgi:hypothetical protein
VTPSKRSTWSTAFWASPSRTRTLCATSQCCSSEAVEQPKLVQFSCTLKSWPRRTSCSKESTSLLPLNPPLTRPISK